VIEWGSSTALEHTKRRASRLLYELLARETLKISASQNLASDSVKERGERESKKEEGRTAPKERE